MFCHNCGFQLKEGTKFCENCGSPAAVQPAEVQAAEMPIQQSAPVESGAVQATELPIQQSAPVEPVTVQAAELPMQQSAPVESGAVQATELPMQQSAPVEPVTVQQGNIYGNAQQGYAAGGEGSPQYYQQPQMQGSVPSYAPQPPARKKKSKLGLIIGIIIGIIILGAAGVFAFNKLIKRDLLNRLIMGYVDISTAERLGMDMEMHFELDPNDAYVYEMAEEAISRDFSSLSSTPAQSLAFISEILPNYKLRMRMAYDLKEEPKLAMKAEMMYKSDSMADVGAYVQPWEAWVDSDSILTDAIYVNIAELLKQNTGVDISTLELAPYIKILMDKEDFSKGLDHSKYIGILKKHIRTKGEDANLKKVGRESVDIKGQSYALDNIELRMTYDEFKALQSDILKELISDPKFREAAQNKVRRIADTAVERGDYAIFGISEEEFKTEADKVVEDLALESTWNMMRETFENIDDQKELTGNAANADILKNTYVIYNFYMSGDKIKQVSAYSYVAGFVVRAETEYYDYDTELMKQIREKDYYDLNELIESGDIFALAGDAVSNLNNNIIQGAAFKNALNDIKLSAVTHLESEDADAVIQLIDEELQSTLDGLQYMLP